jgi:hypothetical protein
MTIRAIVPEDFQGYETPIPVNRNNKNTSGIAAISAEGCPMRPLFVVSRKTMETGLLLRGFTEDKCVILSPENALRTEIYSRCGRQRSSFRTRCKLGSTSNTRDGAASFWMVLQAMSRPESRRRAYNLNQLLINLLDFTTSGIFTLVY